MYLFKYEGIIRSKIISYKFDDKPYLYKSFCEIFVKNKKVCEFLKNYDIIISVPMYKKKKNQRGYNQSELIAREIAKKVKNIEYRSDILLKIKNTANQSLLNKEQRQENLKNAYEVKNKEYISNKNILIFDDIYTTGSTANECSKMLVEAGARSIGILTIAKD
ncbi:putative amidophosphoribosyltransferase [Clostridium sp. CAG:273]|nr:putative amidophosphoribosyltransferase [Clostridium sp. CAG:273]